MTRFPLEAGLGVASGGEQSGCALSRVLSWRLLSRAKDAALVSGMLKGNDRKETT